MTTHNWGNRKHVPTHIRKRILTRDNHTCQACGTQAPAQYLEVDHIDNTRSSHYNHPANLQLLCKPCHQQKTMRESRIAIKRKTATAKHPIEPHPGTLGGHPSPH